MKEKYVYVKLTDNGISGSNLYWCDYEEPQIWIIDLLKLEKQQETRRYKTNLINIGEACLELVAVTPTQYEERGHYTKVSNIYIFKGIIEEII